MLQQKRQDNKIRGVVFNSSRLEFSKNQFHTHGTINMYREIDEIYLKTFNSILSYSPQNFFGYLGPSMWFLKLEKLDCLKSPRKDFFSNNFFNIGQGLSNAVKLNWNLLVFFFIHIHFRTMWAQNNFWNQISTIVYPSLTTFFLSAVKNSNLIPVALSLCTKKLMRSSTTRTIFNYS